MGTPAEYLPRPISEAVINALLVDNGFPEAISIASAKVTAEYYAIYRITVPPNTRSAHTDLILRVSGHHLPRIKTENEVGVMSWVSRNTSIPIPDLVAWDASTDNPLTYEYTLLSRVQGDTLSDIYRSLDESQIRLIIDQLIDFLSQLHTHSWHEIGGFEAHRAGRHCRRPSYGRIILATP